MLIYDRKVSALSVPHCSQPHSEPVLLKQQLGIFPPRGHKNLAIVIGTSKPQRVAGCAYQPWHLLITIQVISHLLRLWFSPSWGSQGSLQGTAPGWTLCFRSCLSLSKVWVSPDIWGYRIWNTFALEEILWCFYSQRCYVKPQNRHSYFAGSFIPWIVWIQCSEVFGVVFLGHFKWTDP